MKCMKKTRACVYLYTARPRTAPDRFVDPSIRRSLETDEARPVQTRYAEREKVRSEGEIQRERDRERYRERARENEK